MIAKLITFVLPLLAPTVVYFLWTYFRGKKAGNDGDATPSKPWLLLIGGGLMLASAVTVILGIVTADPDRGTYVPPHMENGELVPGGYVQEDKAE